MSDKSSPYTSMVMLTAKSMEFNERTVIAIALVYNKGGWNNPVTTKEVDLEYELYVSEGKVSEHLVWFCLDYLSGRISPNWLLNRINALDGYRTTSKK